MNKKLMVTSNK